MIKQYSPYPPPYQRPQSGQQSKNKTFLYITIFSVLVIIVFVIAFLFIKPSKPPTKPVCGNQICEAGENCYDCAADCKCGSAQYCSQTTKTCVSPQCGNKVCEPLENPNNCCDDCYCSLPNEACNPNTHKCVARPLNITDARAVELATNYYEQKGKTVVTADAMGVISYYGKAGVRVKITIKNQDWPNTVIVTEDETVTELPTT